MSPIRRPLLHPRDTEKAKKDRQFKNFVQWAPLLLTLVTICVGVGQFVYQQSRNDRDEFRRQIWGKRLTAFTEIANELATVVKVANAGAGYNRDSLVKAVTKYDQVYDRNLMLFYGLKLDKDTEERLLEFRRKISDKLTGIEVDAQTLEKSQEDVSIIFQQNVRESWTELGK